MFKCNHHYKKHKAFAFKKKADTNLTNTEKTENLC